MELLERIISFAIGVGVGLILGYIVGRIHNIEREVHEVLDIEKNLPCLGDQKKDEEGSMRIPNFNTVALLVVVALTTWAAFSASATNRALDDTVSCLTQFNANQNQALITRDEAIKSSADAEIELWTLYNELYQQAESNPKKIPVIQEQLNEAINEYRATLIETQAVRDTYEYGEPESIQNCEDEEQDG